MLPTFLIIGAMKAGTTSLAEYLGSHPDVYVPDGEPQFFSAEHNWTRGFEWYSAQLAAGAGCKAVGEKSATYSMHPIHAGVPARVAAAVPDMRLIYVLRDPIRRISSHYLHNVARGLEWRPIEDAIEADPTYLAFSRYATQIEQYLPHFPVEQLLVVTTDELKARRRETVARALEFIGVDATVVPANIEEEIHRTADKPIPRGFVARVKRMPGYPQLAKVAPTGLKKKVFSLGAKPMDGDAGRLSPEGERRYRELLRPEMERLQAYIADPAFDGWGLITS